MKSKCCNYNIYWWSKKYWFNVGKAHCSKCHKKCSYADRPDNPIVDYFNHILYKLNRPKTNLITKVK